MIKPTYMYMIFYSLSSEVHLVFNLAKTILGTHFFYHCITYTVFWIWRSSTSAKRLKNQSTSTLQHNNKHVVATPLNFVALLMHNWPHPLLIGHLSLEKCVFCEFKGVLKRPDCIVAQTLLHIHCLHYIHVL